MSLDAAEGKLTTAEDGGTAEVSAASDGGRASVGEGRLSQGAPRASTGESKDAGGDARRSNAGEKRVSGGSGAGRVSVGEGKEGGGRGSQASAPRGSQGSAGGEEVHGEDCSCEDCVCPPEEDVQEDEKGTAQTTPEDQLEAYPLDEFMRAKAYFQQVSSKSGLSLYDHLSDVIRKFLDERAPNNPVDFLEEVSMNVKRYRFGLKKDDALQDVFYISEGVLSDAERLYSYFKSFANFTGDRKAESSGEGEIFPGGSFQNLLRLQYYAEQINIGLSREEMYRVALGIKELGSSRSQIGRLRFWGKIFGIQKNYYVVEAELKSGGTAQAIDLWTPKDDGGLGEIMGDRRASDGNRKMQMNANQTFSRAKDVVLNRNILQHYANTSGFKQAARSSMEGDGDPIQDAGDRAESMKWEEYQQELMQNFPQTKTFEPTQVPPEPDGSGVNRRVFYVCNELGKNWTLLPAVTPQQINASRATRWYLTGNLDSAVTSIPAFPGKEGHYLKTLLARITAGAMCSPKGYFKSKPAVGEVPGEEDDEEVDGEDAEHSNAKNDLILPAKKYNANMKALTNPNLTSWVHHTSYILLQGRIDWWNPAATKPKRRSGSDYGSETAESSEMEDEDEDDDEIEVAGKEVSPPLFRSISSDKAADGKGPWSITTSSSVFSEFQVVSVRSNVWPGSYAICTNKGKVANVYFGDGLKFSPTTYCPPLSEVPTREYKSGPELEETQDPSADQEQGFLNKLAQKETEENEVQFVDNDDALTTGDDEEDESAYEY